MPTGSRCRRPSTLVKRSVESLDTLSQDYTLTTQKPPVSNHLPWGGHISSLAGEMHHSLLRKGISGTRDDWKMCREKSVGFPNRVRTNAPDCYLYRS